jgi:hypothetical protein
MRRTQPEFVRRLTGSAGLALWVAFFVAACGSSSPTAALSSGSLASSSQPGATSPTPPAPSVAPTPGPSKGPASALFNLAGSNGLTGPMTSQTILCAEPSLDGPLIEVLGVSGAAGPGIVLFVTAGHIEARVGTGAAATLKLRSFVGTGVTSFDAATGVQLDSALTETTPPGSAIGTLGALTRISGTLDCGNQQAGTANIVLTGLTPFGQMSTALTQPRVNCSITAAGTYVGARTLGMAGSTPVLVFVTASTGMLQVSVETGSEGSFYAGKGAAIVTLVPGGAQMSADLTETVKAGVTPHMLHVEGSDTCGTTVNE